MAFVIHRPGIHFGDKILAGFFTTILNDNGIEAYFFDEDPNIGALLDVPLWDGTSNYEWWRFNYRIEHAWDGRGILRKAIDNFRNDFSIISNIQCTRSAVPVRYDPDPLPPTYCVSMCLDSGHWSPYRSWPYKIQLQAALSAAGISWIDLKNPALLGADLLRQVAATQLFLGVETGVSHFVSSVVKKALIIQSGYSNIDFWSVYKFDYMAIDCACKNCFLRRGCPHDNLCMTEITVEQVLERIKRLLM